MRFASLTTVRQRLVVGRPLPFNVRDHDRALLLARGQTLVDHAQLQALLERGALVDLEELKTPRERAMEAPREALPRLWHESLTHIQHALLNAPPTIFSDALEDASDALMGLVERDADLAIFQVLARQADFDTAYGVRRSMHTAITAWLVANRLGWDAEALERVFKVGLTSNLSMLELQGVLARQQQPLTPEQRTELLMHPMRSLEMLMIAGIDDEDWLQAVARHHEEEDASGYPTGRTDVGELASVVRRADAYTAKLSSRSYRQALSADVAGRQMFMRDAGHPMTAALVKEFGIYPPGCFVRLIGGETGIVVQRGPTVATPIVACLRDAKGRMLATPGRVDTSWARYRIEAVVGEQEAPRAPSLDQLLRALH